MDGFVKVRRNRNQGGRSSSKQNDGQGDVKEGPGVWQRDRKLDPSPLKKPPPSSSLPQVDTAAGRNVSRPLHFAAISNSLPFQLSSITTSQKEYDETTNSCASSGYLPSFSSSDSDDSDIPSSSCSSPLTCSGYSCDDDLDDAIERAELCSKSYKESLAVSAAIHPHQQQQEHEQQQQIIQSQHDEEKKAAPRFDTRQEFQKMASHKGALVGSGSETKSSSPLFMLSADLFAEVMCFLDPPETLKVLTTPLCKEFRRSYSTQQDLWRVLCGFKPFKATVWSDDSSDESSSEESFCSLSSREPMVNDIFGKYRLRYTSFVRCMRYLSRIKEDARNGRPPSVVDLGQRGGFPNFGVSKSLKKFLSQNKGSSLGGGGAGAGNGTAPALNQEEISPSPIGVSDEGNTSDQGGKKRPASSLPNSVAKKPKFGNSMITSRLLGPAANGQVAHLSLPQSCAIYSIVNWMVAFPDVEGIQTMCIDCLPCLLEDEQQRLTAQRVGLVEVVLRAMLRFRGCLDLHVAALHTMVLLARPLGGKEGMLFDHTMAESSANLGLASSGPSVLARLSRGRSAGSVASLDRRYGSRLSGINGIAIMVDSMQRFESEAKLQAMGCWAMVNLALVPAQKTMLLNSNALQAVIKAMQTHSDSFDVQFRALFALINLVVPCGEPRDNIPPGQVDEFRAEKELLDSNMDEISRLVVGAMKNFCSSETILNRACLVLHNISQNSEYLSTLLWTPHCYQMVEWSIVNHPTDQVLRRSAVSVLHRLQVLLSTSQVLSARFREFARSHQQFSITNPAINN